MLQGCRQLPALLVESGPALTSRTEAYLGEMSWCVQYKPDRAKLPRDSPAVSTAMTAHDGRPGFSAVVSIHVAGPKNAMV